MVKYSAGILLYRFRNNRLEVLLVHPGGPFWAKKDEGAWSIPKGLIEENEDVLDAAKREFKEEIGIEVDGNFIDLGEVKQSSRKMVHIFALEKDLEVKNIVSNTFKLEWPKGSGIIHEYPEVDKAEWFSIEEAKKKILKGQREFIDRLINVLNYKPKKEPKQKTLLDFYS